MSFVDDDETHVHLLQIVVEKLGRKTLRRDVKEPEVSVCGIIESQLDFPASHSGMDTQGLYATVIEILHLVLHQGYERSHDYRDAITHQGWHLEAHGLAASRRKNGKDIPSVQSGIYYVFLLRTERIITPVFFQNIMRRDAVVSVHYFILLMYQYVHMENGHILCSKCSENIRGGVCQITKKSYFCTDICKRVKP